MFDKYASKGAYHWRECDRSSGVFNPPLAARYQAVVQRVAGGRAIDLGAGDGYLAGRLAPLCSEVVALEYEPEGAELARQMLAGHANVIVQRGDAYNVPYPDRSFDSVIMADVIEHLDQPEQAVREMSRLVAPDGQVLVTTPQWRPDRVWDHRHVKEYTAEEFRALLSPGFDSVELSFCWPRMWSDFYRTRIGWRLLRLAGRLGFNPFTSESAIAEGRCQMLAVCRSPRAAAA